MRETSSGPRVTAEDRIIRELRAELRGAEAALGDAEGLIRDLSRQLDRANAAAVRMARLVLRVRRAA